MDAAGEDWEPWRTFGAIEREGSFSRASSALGISQSSVSRHVAALEQRTGRALFSRRGRRIALTDEGRALASAARGAEDAMLALERAAHSLRGTVAGEVRITSAPELASRLLAPRVPALLARHPELRLVLTARSELESLTSGGLDVALRVVAPRAAELVRRRVGVLRYRVFAAGAAKGERAFVGYDRSLAMLPEARWLERHHGERIVVRASQPEAVAAIAAAGSLACVIAEPLASLWPALSARGSVLFERAVYSVTHREQARTPRIRAVLEWLAECGEAL